MNVPESAASQVGRKLQFVTVATPDFLPVVCVLAESLRAHEPGASLACYLLGAAPTPEHAALLPFEVRRADTLPIPGARRFFFQYTAKELCCALKPHILADALRRNAGAAAAFLDADILVCAPFVDLFLSHLDAHAVLVTPHLLSPGPAPHVLTIMRAGIYNAGVVAVRGGAEGERFLNWWQERVQRDCIRDPCGGVSGDQRWLDMAVGLFDFVRPLRDPGVNVGFWNLHERALQEGDGSIVVNGSHVLRLLHFSHVTMSGFAPFAAANMGPGEQPVALEIARRYHGRIAEWAARCPRAIPDDVHTRFADGTPISPAQREAVRCNWVAVADPFEDRAGVEAAAPKDPVVIFGRRAGFWAESGPELVARANAELARANAELDRLRSHIVVGRIIALWRRLVNPRL